MYVYAEEILIFAIVVLGLCIFLFRKFLHQRQSLAHFAPIVDADAEAERIVKEAKAELKKAKNKSKRIVKEAEQEKKNAKTQYDQSIADADYESQRILDEAETKRKDVIEQGDRLRKENRFLEDYTERLKEKLRPLEDDYTLQSHGLYEPKYDFAEAVNYKNRLTAIRKKQKQMIRDKTAAVCDVDWEVSGSRREGKKMTGEQLRLMLRAFNGECDSLIMKVKYNNVHSIEKRIGSVFDAVNKLGKTKQSYISRKYLSLKHEELYLVLEYEEKKYEEKEEQKEIKRQMREEAKAEKELRDALVKAEKEERQYQKTLEKVQRELAKKGVSERNRARMEEKIDVLEAQLSDARANRERIRSRGEITKSGHVYVLSNLGSLGGGIYKIGMTRRFEPDERVKELSSASVPFPFDVHAMIYSDDAPGLEKALHSTFEDARVNKVNLRKEFFQVPIEDVQEAIAEYDSDAKFKLTVMAEEYYKSEAAKRSHGEQGEGRILTGVSKESVSKESA